MSRVPVSVGLSKPKFPVVLNGALPAIKLGVSNVQPGLKGAAPFVGFPVKPFETAMLIRLGEPDAFVETDADDSAQMELAAVDAQLAEVEGKIEQVQESLLSGKANTASVIELLAKLDAKRSELQRRQQELRRRRSDDGEVNFYAATTGKSGGQKAKLAFTILASALCAQYGLTSAAPDAPQFRLVVIDEAFSRTDETNSTRAMQLFERLGFQLLIVGPFDAKAKLAVPFVDSIHLVANPGGNDSRLHALSRADVERDAPPATSPDGALRPSLDHRPIAASA